jgi:uncharacterized protein with FMN-binding domain
MFDAIKKIVLSSSVIVLFALYALQRQTDSPGGELALATAPTAVALFPSSTVIPGEPPSQITPRNTSSARNQGARDAAAAQSSSLRRPTATKTSGAYRDGTYTGVSADANWGNVEVQAIIQNGQIADVQFLDFPDHRSRSRSINAQAMPLLTQEAIQSQQADVDFVTGATDTSAAFVESLTSALRQAAP